MEFSTSLDGLCRTYQTCKGNIVRVYFFACSFQIKESYRYTKAEMRSVIKYIVTDLCRFRKQHSVTVNSIFGAWLVHSICYKLHIKRSLMKDSSISYLGPENVFARIGYELFGKLY